MYSHFYTLGEYPSRLTYVYFIKPGTGEYPCKVCISEGVYFFSLSLCVGKIKHTQTCIQYNRDESDDSEFWFREGDYLQMLRNAVMEKSAMVVDFRVTEME